MDKHKMNVGPAVQPLSSSVATAIDILWREANLPEFEGSEVTIDFITKVEITFDMLNSWK